VTSTLSRRVTAFLYATLRCKWMPWLLDTIKGVTHCQGDRPQATHHLEQGGVTLHNAAAPCVLKNMIGYYRRTILHLSFQLQKLRREPENLSLLISLQNQILEQVLHSTLSIKRHSRVPRLSVERAGVGFLLGPVF
jgi:hypothetical protein